VEGRALPHPSPEFVFSSSREHPDVDILKSWFFSLANMLFSFIPALSSVFLIPYTHLLISCRTKLWVFLVFRRSFFILCAYSFLPLPSVAPFPGSYLTGRSLDTYALSFRGVPTPIPSADTVSRQLSRPFHQPFPSPPTHRARNFFAASSSGNCFLSRSPFGLAVP